eukprot:TRINITY_DN27255_c0_g1_i2.p1 TRINITY_DN27255_c0_g1~~TRINITY_DN27255_c0_g1_i2.p1  ORF type:complete len:811 (-),score=150.84 TRINITY_DN27255_c0_g1_i2:59-2491(-)
MVPSPQEVAAAIDDLSALALAGLSQAVFFAVFAFLCGEQALPGLQLFGLLGADAVRRALENAQVLDDSGRRRQLSPEEQRRAALVWRAARYRQGLPDDQDPLPVSLASEATELSQFLATPTSNPTTASKRSAQLPSLTRRSAAKILESIKAASAEENSMLTVRGVSYTHGINSLRALLLHGGDLGAPIPTSRWDADVYFDPDGKKGLGIYTRHAAITDLPGPVDYNFFGISKEDAAVMDPQQRSCLQEGFRAIRSAKVTPQALRNSHAGVYVGSMNFDYLMSGAGTLDSGNMPLMASRLSHALGLRGPALFMDTGCSASLVAADVAAGHVRRGRATVALALGVNHVLSPLAFLARCSIKLLSRIGHCASFNASADGYVVGEGCGAAVLGWAKSASSSRPCWRCSQVMEDGRSAQLTAPSGPAQQELLRETLRRGSTQPGEVALSECQANGSQLGDPIETGAIEKIQAGSIRKGCLHLMSGKTNKGHGEGAAGITTLIKLILALEDKLVAPLVHFSRLNGHIDIADSLPVLFSSESLKLPQLLPGETVKASGSSFGFGGVNAHVILETSPEKLVAVRSTPPQVPSSTVAQPQAVRTMPQAIPKAVQPSLSLEDARRMVRNLAKAAIDDDLPDMEVALAESGLDSLSAVALRNTLQTETKLPLPGTLMFDYPTMQSIAEFLVEQSAAASPEHPPETVATSAPAAAPVPAAVASGSTLARADGNAEQAAPPKPTMSSDEVRKLVAATVKTALDDELPDAETSLTESGLDSLSAIAVRNELTTSLGISMPGTLLFDHPSISELSSFITDQLQTS